MEVFEPINVSDFGNSSPAKHDGNTTSLCTWYLPPFEWLKLVTLFAGVAGNGLTVVAIATDRKLHTKTYATIAAIAVADCVYCTMAVLWSTLLFAYLDYSNYRQYRKCINDFLFLLMNTVVAVLFSASYLASSLSISLLSIVRFVILSLPLKANTILRKSSLVFIIILIWFFSIALAVCKNIPLQSISRKNINLVDVFFTFIVPLLTIIIFHGMKIFTLKQSEYRKTEVKKMERLVVAIILLFFVCNLPWQVLRLLAQYKVFVPGYLLQTTMGYLLQFNNCVNPVFYAFLSPRIRHSICILFCRFRANQ
nr:apelin receptor A [Crassostrea gigas]